MILYRPVASPLNQNNLFGANPQEYKPLGYDGHPGLDFECPIGTPIYSPCDGDAFYAHDKAGGDGIWIRVPNNGKPKANIILWHMVPPGDAQYPFQIDTTPGVVTKVKIGQLLGYSGNSGFPLESTGPHCHVAYLPCDFTGAASDPNNGYHGCVDPLPFLSNILAENYDEIQATVQAAAAVSEEVAQSNLPIQEKLSFWSKVVQFLKLLLK